MPLNCSQANYDYVILEDAVNLADMLERQGADPRSSPALVVYVKHAHPVSEKTRLDIWSGPILPC